MVIELINQWSTGVNQWAVLVHNLILQHAEVSFNMCVLLLGTQNEKEKDRKTARHSSPLGATAASVMSEVAVGCRKCTSKS